MYWFQIVDGPPVLLRVFNLAAGTLSDVSSLVDDIDFIGHVDLPFMHVVQHGLGPFRPDFVVAGMAEETDRDNDVPFQRQAFLRLYERVLEARTAAKGNDFVFADHILAVMLSQLTDKVLRENHILHISNLGEQRGDFLRLKACNPAAYAGHKEPELRVLTGESNELIDIRLDGLYAALHGGNGVAMSLEANALPPDSAEALVCQPGSPASMRAGKVAAKDEDFVFL